MLSPARAFNLSNRRMIAKKLHSCENKVVFYVLFNNRGRCSVSRDVHTLLS